MTETNPASPPVLLAVEDAIARITFNRPGVLNALDEASILALKAVADRLSDMPHVRAVVVAGEGRAFLAGGDVSRFHAAGEEAPDLVDGLIQPFHQAILTLAALNAPVIASVQGAAAGGGLSLALACDLCIAADDARFNMAYARIGTSPDGGGTFHLPRLVGLRRAMELALLSTDIGAQEALALGLVNKVVPAADLKTETDALARRIASGPTLAFGRIKRLLRASFSHSLTEQLAAEREAFVGSAGTADFREGVAAFVEKRKADFKGR